MLFSQLMEGVWGVRTRRLPQKPVAGAVPELPGLNKRDVDVLEHS